MPDNEQLGSRHLVARDFLIPLLVGAVGLGGSLGGVYLANANNARQADVQKAIEYEGKIVDQRLALIDRTAKIFGESPGLMDLWSRYLEPVHRPKAAPKLAQPLDVTEKLMEAQGEFQSVVFLAQAYFGPKTKAAITDLSSVQGPWWTKPKDKQNALVDAMIEETWLGLKALPDVLRRVQ